MLVKKRKFGSAIKDIRQVKQLTKTKLAESTGFSRKDIAEIEKGRREISETDIKLLAKGLELPDACLILMGTKINGKKFAPVQNFADSLNRLTMACLQAREYYKANPTAQGNGKAKPKKAGKKTA